MERPAGALPIIGKAGSGKSVLAKTIQQGVSQHWKSINPGSARLLVGDWFYCRRRGEIYTAYDSLLRCVLVEYLAKEKPIFQHYKALSRRKQVAGTSNHWTTDELEEVLTLLNTSRFPLFMVFDGIDEATDDRMVGLVESLVQDPNSAIRAIFLSRPKQDFETAYWRSRTVVLQHENDSDIAQVVFHGLGKLRYIISGSPATEEAIITQKGGW